MDDAEKRKPVSKILKGMFPSDEVGGWGVSDRACAARALVGDSFHPAGTSTACSICLRKYLEACCT